MPGSTARKIRFPAPVALLEEARGLAALLQPGLEAQAHHHPVRLGRRGRGPAGLHGMGRGRTPRNCAATPPFISTPTATAAATCEWTARTRWKSSSTAWRATSKIPRRSCRSGSALQLAAHREPAPRAAERDAGAAQRADLRIGALGSGSDYTAFLDHLGIASLNLGFGGEDGGGIYHSIYDDFYWYTHFADTDFVYGRALAQTAGTAVMRLADAELLPYDFDNFTDTIRRYIDEVQKLAKDKRDQIVERNRQIDEGLFAATMDPRVPHDRAAQGDRAAVPELRAARKRAGRAAAHRRAYDKALAQATENGGAALARAALKEANDKLIQVERALTLNEGLPNRPWFKHQIYAPGFYTGYGVKTLPAVRESIEQKEWKLADEEIAQSRQGAGKRRGGDPRGDGGAE